MKFGSNGFCKETEESVHKAINSQTGKRNKLRRTGGKEQQTKVDILQVIFQITECIPYRDRKSVV